MIRLVHTRIAAPLWLCPDVRQEKDERALQFTKEGVPEFANISNTAPLWTKIQKMDATGTIRTLSGEFVTAFVNAGHSD